MQVREAVLATAAGARPLVLAMVGTDHHPFDRMVDWVDALATSLPSGADVVVQHGHTHPPRRAQGRDFCSSAELVELIARAAVVICHGGPATIANARDAGHVPLCVPRDPRRGEHVDGHQQRFVEALHRLGVVVRPDSQAELLTSASLWLSDPSRRPVARPGLDRLTSTRAFAGRADLLLAQECRRRDPFLRSLRGIAPSIRHLTHPGHAAVDRPPTQPLPTQRPAA